MDDEDVYYANNQLHQYLSSFDDFAGRYDVIQTKNNADENVITAPVVKSKSLVNHEIDNKTLSFIICKILKTGLLLEEDAQYTETIAEPHENCIQQCSSLSQYKSKLLFIGSTFLGSVLYFTKCRHISIPYSISVGIGLITVSCGMWKYQKIRQQQRQVQSIEDLVSALQKLFQVLKKATQLIQENETLVRGNILVKSSAISFSSLPNHVAKYQLMISLRSAVTVTIRQIVCMFANCTKQLTVSIPLAGQPNFQQNYIATLNSDPVALLNVSDDLPLSTLRHNHNVYLLLQSEFLKHLALCFCPKLWLHRNNVQFHELNIVTSTITCETIKLQNNLQKEYMAFYLYGMSDNKKPKPIQESWKYSDIYVATHSAGLHLQAMLLKVRAVEDLLEKNSGKEEDNLIDNIQNIFDEVLNEKDLFESCCKQSVNQIQKLKVVAQVRSSDKEMPELVNLMTDRDVIEQESIYRCDNYIVEDEVFEATSCQDDIFSEEPCSSISRMLSKEERINREIERQISWRMVKELKTVLVSKAAEWKERERRALLRKAGLDVSSPEEVQPLKELPCSNGEWPLPRLKKGLPKKFKANYRPRRHSTIGLGCSSELSGLTDIVTSLPPFPSDTVCSKDVSPLKELPCNIGEWPLPRLKKGLPKKYRSGCTTRRHSTIGLDCTSAVGLGYSSELSKEGLTLVATLAPFPSNTSCSKDISPLRELPCNIGEWPLPRLKKGLPKKNRSSFTKRRHSTIGLECAGTVGLGYSSELSKDGLTDIVASSPPFPSNTSCSKDVSPLKELPCSIGEWPLPRLKKGLPKKYQSGFTKRRHSTIGLECTYSFDKSDVSQNDVKGSVSHLKYNPNYRPAPLPDLSPQTVPSPLAQSVLPPPPLPPPPQVLSQEQNVSENEFQSGLDSIFKGAEQFWKLRNQPIEDTFCGTGENVEEEEELIDSCEGEN